MVVVVAEEAVVQQKRRHQAMQQQRIRATCTEHSTERSIAASWPLVGPWLVAFVSAVVVVLCRVLDPLLKAPMRFCGLLLVWNRLCCSMMTILVRI